MSRLLAVTGESDGVGVWEARGGRTLYRLSGRSERNPKGHSQAVLKDLRALQQAKKT